MIDIELRNEGRDDEGEETAELIVTYSGLPSVDLAVNSVKPLLVIQPGVDHDAVMGVLRTISAREKSGFGTPVTAELADDLNIRELLLALAMEIYP